MSTARKLTLTKIQNEGEEAEVRLIIREKHPEFAEEYGRLTVPIFQAIEDGTVQSLYRRLNPRAVEGIDAMESKQDQDSF